MTTQIEDLSTEVQQRIDNEIAKQPDHTADDKIIYEQLELRGHGVALTELQQYARLIRWRNRLGYIGRLVRQFTGAEPADDQRGWARTAGMMLTAALVEALDREPGEISTAELTQCARIFHECRMVTAAAHPSTTHRTDDTPPHDDRLPAEFVETVRSIYGVTLDDPAPSEATASKIDATKKAVPPPAPSC